MPALSDTLPVFGFASAGAGGAGVCASAGVVAAAAPNASAATARRMLLSPRPLIVAVLPRLSRDRRSRSSLTVEVATLPSPHPRPEQVTCRTLARKKTRTYARRASMRSARDKHHRPSLPVPRARGTRDRVPPRASAHETPSAKQRGAPVHPGRLERRGAWGALRGPPCRS